MAGRADLDKARARDGSTPLLRAAERGLLGTKGLETPTALERFQGSEALLRLSVVDSAAPRFWTPTVCKIMAQILQNEHIWHICMCVSLCIYIYIYTYTHIYIYVHAYQYDMRCLPLGPSPQACEDRGVAHRRQGQPRQSPIGRWQDGPHASPGLRALRDHPSLRVGNKMRLDIVLFTYLYSCMYPHTHEYIYIYTYIHVPIYVHIYICIYRHI